MSDNDNRLALPDLEGNNGALPPNGPSPGSSDSGS